MATKRLIDANALINVLRHRVKGNEDSPFVIGTNNTLDIFADFVQSIPTVDAVEMVRCRDCKHWDIRTGNDPSLKYFCNVDGMWCKPARSADDYCSYGERKDNGNRTEL